MTIHLVRVLPPESCDQPSYSQD